MNERIEAGGCGLGIYALIIGCLATACMAGWALICYGG